MLVAVFQRQHFAGYLERCRTDWAQSQPGITPYLQMFAVHKGHHHLAHQDKQLELCTISEVSAFSKSWLIFFLLLNFTACHYATAHAWKWRAPSRSKSCYKKKKLSPGQIHFSKWWGWCEMKLVLKWLAPRTLKGLKRYKLKCKNYKLCCHLQLQKLLPGQNSWQNEAGDGCSRSTFLLCGFFPWH